MNTNDYTQKIATELNLKSSQVQQTINLLSEGGTVPFIARYRKEATGSLDEVSIAAIRDLEQNWIDFTKRRTYIIDTLSQKEILTTELQGKLLQAVNLVELEDLYLPFKTKRKTRAAIAKEKGLAPLAEVILKVNPPSFTMATFLSGLKEDLSEEEALGGARDIVAEHFAEDLVLRKNLRTLFKNESLVTSTLIKKMATIGVKYKDYFDWQEPAAKAPGHRILAMLRAENEKVIKLKVRPESAKSLNTLDRYLSQHKQSRWYSELKLATEDSYQRLLAPSLENELRKELKEKADAEAIHVFTDNLRQLLLAPPLGAKRVMAIDPGYRTGCKVVCLDAHGHLEHSCTIFPTLGKAQQVEARDTILSLVSQFNIEAIAIGNGTAGRETESFIRSLDIDRHIIVTMVNEDGASIYSASEIGRAEFPDHDITVRGAVSIGRRLQDPLAELVKLDPKSIGVGQYQHDVNQTELRKALDDTVMSCVNSIGVEINSASKSLLTYIAGVGPTLADNIIAHREDSGSFTNLKQLLKVKRLGPKAYEQCAGFLRIRGGVDPLDSTGVHPERYKLIEKMASDFNITTTTLISSPKYQQQINIHDYVTEQTGLPTLIDIQHELAKPGRDPRESFEEFRFDDNIHSMADLHIGMLLPAIITNITKFGAFADVGIKQDGLIHISQLADKFVKDPGEVVRIGQKVQARVLEIDQPRNRIALSLKNL